MRMLERRRKRTQLLIISRERRVSRPSDSRKQRTASTSVTIRPEGGGEKGSRPELGTLMPYFSGLACNFSDQTSLKPAR